MYYIDSLNKVFPLVLILGSLPVTDFLAKIPMPYMRKIPFELLVSGASP